VDQMLLLMPATGPAKKNKLKPAWTQAEKTWWQHYIGHHTDRQTDRQEDGDQGTCGKEIWSKKYRQQSSSTVGG